MDGQTGQSSHFARRALVAAGITLALVLIYLLRGVLLPLFFAFLLAYALDPFVDRLETWKVPRTIGAILVMAALTGLFILFLFLAVPYFAVEIRDAAADLPEQIDKLRS
ncbi:MAG TPA: AI-2E family transporter, partial [Polyangiaceae bacterium]|nr:AI-2E family transporter [Polyangiaceae bacterium]